MILRAKNWAEFQHYKDRSPVWIKLHRKLLDDRAFHRLPDASRALAPMLWLLCSESEDGSIKDAHAEIAFRLRMTDKKVEEALNPLIEAGFFCLEQEASEMLAKPEQDSSLEKRREREEEEERAFAAFVDAARKHEWPKPQKLDSDRRKKLRARLDEHGSDGWTQMLGKASASDFLCSKFALKLDWILEPKNFRKVIEGNYDPKPSDPSTGSGLPPAEPWEQRVTGWVKSRQWLPQLWGPAPGESGCRAPPKIVHQVMEAHRP